MGMRKWEFPSETSAQLFLGTLVWWGFGVRFLPPFLIQFFLSPHCIPQFLTVGSVMELDVNVAGIS